MEDRLEWRKLRLLLLWALDLFGLYTSSTAPIR